MFSREPVKLNDEAIFEIKVFTSLGEHCDGTHAPILIGE